MRRSRAKLLSSDPKATEEFLASLSDDEALMALYEWPFWARPEQLSPPGDWTIWLYMGGRGAGKTRAGAEWIRARVNAGIAKRIALVAATFAEARDVLVEGESGLLAISSPIDRPRFEKSKRRLTWPNGAIALLFSDDEPDMLRGAQSDTAWCDELAKWKHLEATFDKFKTSYRLILLLPGDIVTLTEPNIGLFALPVRITSVTENDDDTLDIEAEEFPGNVGTYYATTVSLATAPTVPNQFETPSSVNTPAIVEPDSAYTGGKAQLVVAASGNPANWGGCEVNISLNGTDYTYIGKIIAPAVQGTLTANLASYSSANPDNTNTLAVDCTESGIAPPLASNSDAQNYRSLCLIAAQPMVSGGIATVPTNGELLAYGANSATGTYTANLTYLYRNAYGTGPASHSTGDQFTVIDILGVSGTSVAFALPTNYIGVPLYIKLASFNRFGHALQSLAACTEYKYTPTGAGYGAGGSGVPSTPTGLAGATSGP